jgi:hypothetical protein
MGGYSGFLVEVLISYPENEKFQRRKLHPHVDHGCGRWGLIS